MKSNRTAARSMWQAIASWEMTHDTQLWLREVAAAVLAADSEPDNARPGAVLKAVGLAGRYDPEREMIRALVMSVDQTCKLIEEGNRWVPARQLRRGERAERRRRAVLEYLDRDESPAAIDKRIARALKD